MIDEKKLLGWEDWARLSVPIQAYFEKLLEEKEKGINYRFANLEQAVAIAKSTVDDKFLTTNEWRLTVIDLVALKATIKDLEALRDMVTAFINRAATRDESIVFQKAVERDIRELRESKANLEGKASQQSVNVAMGIALLGLLLGVMGLIVSLLRG